MLSLARQLQRNIRCIFPSAAYPGLLLNTPVFRGSFAETEEDNLNLSLVALSTDAGLQQPESPASDGFMHLHTTPEVIISSSCKSLSYIWDLETFSLAEVMEMRTFICTGPASFKHS